MSTTIPTFEQHLVTEPPNMKFAVEKDEQRKPPDTNIPGLDLDMGLSYPSKSLRFLKPLQSKIQLNQQTVPQARVPLRVVIVGAGLGGLATSIALARRGHSVLVLEQAHRLGEVGAGIQIPPNSGSLLRRWGVLQHLESKAVRPDSINFRRWANGATIGYTDLRQFEANFRAPYYVCHRAHLHEALHARAIELGVEVRLESKVARYCAAESRVELVGGSDVSGDLVVAADGIRSGARATILGSLEPQAPSTGFAAYRATVDVEKMKAHPELCWILEKPALNIWIGEGRHVMTYTISGGRSFNMVLSHVDKSDPASWTQDAALEDMRQHFQDWDPQLKKIISLIDSCLKWPLKSGAKLQSWVHESSKLLILGDAAHAMVPYMSQGAAMAVEDGAALAKSLNGIEDREQIPAALRRFEAERMERSSAMQDASMMNGVIWHYPDGPEQELRDAGMSAEVEGRPFAWSPNQWSDPVTQWWAYGYDAEDAMERKARIVPEAKK